MSKRKYHFTELDLLTMAKQKSQGMSVKEIATRWGIASDAVARMKIAEGEQRQQWVEASKLRHRMDRVRARAHKEYLAILSSNKILT